MVTMELWDQHATEQPEEIAPNGGTGGAATTTGTSNGKNGTVPGGGGGGGLLLAEQGPLTEGMEQMDKLP